MLHLVALVSSISNFFINKIALANKWMRKIIPSHSNSALERRPFLQNTNSVTKMTFFPHKRISKKKYDVWNFKPKSSPIFHFELVNEGWIIAILGLSPGHTACNAKHGRKRNNLGYPVIATDFPCYRENSKTCRITLLLSQDLHTLVPISTLFGVAVQGHYLYQTPTFQWLTYSEFL